MTAVDLFVQKLSILLKDFVTPGGGANFRAKDFWSPFADENWTIPIVAVIFYFIFVHGGQLVMKRLPALPLKFVFALWNLALSAFSLMGTVGYWPYVISRLASEGLMPTVCVDGADTFLTGRVGVLTTVFILSKIPELGDTVLLVLQKKPVSFLHWYHHITVLLFCWDALGNHIAYGSYFVAMNYTVHTVMYFYFGMMSLSDFTRSLVKPIAPFITTIQLVQMAGGMFIIAYAWLYAKDGPNCYVTEVNMISGLAMYASYFLLFLQLFIENYITKSKDKKKKSTALKQE